MALGNGAEDGDGGDDEGRLEWRQEGRVGRRRGGTAEVGGENRGRGWTREDGRRASKILGTTALLRGWLGLGQQRRSAREDKKAQSTASGSCPPVRTRSDAPAQSSSSSSSSSVLMLAVESELSRVWPLFVVGDDDAPACCAPSALVLAPPVVPTLSSDELDGLEGVTSARSLRSRM